MITRLTQFFFVFGVIATLIGGIYVTILMQNSGEEGLVLAEGDAITPEATSSDTSPSASSQTTADPTDEIEYSTPSPAGEGATNAVQSSPVINLSPSISPSPSSTRVPSPTSSSKADLLEGETKEDLLISPSAIPTQPQQLPVANGYFLTVIGSVILAGSVITVSMLM